MFPYTTDKYIQPMCESPDCYKGADISEDGHEYCAKHYESMLPWIRFDKDSK
jgi:hypothetical protein